MGNFEFSTIVFTLITLSFAATSGASDSHKIACPNGPIIEKYNIRPYSLKYEDLNGTEVRLTITDTLNEITELKESDMKGKKGNMNVRIIYMEGEPVHCSTVMLSDDMWPDYLTSNVFDNENCIKKEICKKNYQDKTTVLSWKIEIDNKVMINYD